VVRKTRCFSLQSRKSGFRLCGVSSLQISAEFASCRRGYHSSCCRPQLAGGDTIDALRAQRREREREREGPRIWSHGWSPKRR
jgi:hypothetical protein